MKRVFRVGAMLLLGLATYGTVAQSQGGASVKWVDFQDWGPIEFCGFSCDSGDTCCMIIIYAE